MDAKIQHLKDSTWQIRPSLNMPDLDPEAVQFAVLDFDPIDAYRKALTLDAEKIQKDIGEEKNTLQRGLRIRVHMTGAWDRLFNAVAGDQVHLLVPSTSKKYESIVRSFVVSSNSSPGRKWVATKVVYKEDEPLCWCIPVEAVIGTSVDVELQVGNLLDIKSLFKEIVPLT